MAKRVAVIGASGFVGTALTERLMRDASCGIVPFIHTSGNAWRLARHGTRLETINLLDNAQTKSLLQGFTHVVNCSRGGQDVMLRGLRNVLAACKENRVRRFVHLSSVMVYGDPPSPDSGTEAGCTAPEPGTYGWIKLAQDNLLRKAADEGLSSVALCPPNISGAQSAYILMILNGAARSELALLDEGRTPCNVVDVENLCRGIELSLDEGPTDGRRLFVTDDHPTTWAHILDALRPLLPDGTELPSIARAELEALRGSDAQTRKRSLKRSLLHLVSSDVREALRKDPLWASVDHTVRQGVRLLGRSVEDRVRATVEGPIVVPQANKRVALNARLCVQQLRGITHSCDEAKRLLGYLPQYSFEQSMEAFRRWYRTIYGLDSPVAKLLQSV